MEDVSEICQLSPLRCSAAHLVYGQRLSSEVVMKTCGEVINCTCDQESGGLGIVGVP